MQCRVRGVKLVLKLLKHNYLKSVFVIMRTHLFLPFVELVRGEFYNLIEL